ncbi:hypothetical protein SAMN04487981_105198 [Streptomyces sp. cf386]|uniref:hypothetical protein n=1 Tax=Streptomyces sp. cf386 TaxID=1761904 RepID=UPI00087EE8C8|nr:hypothetical protein [Streptomyces sp. cf386]SDN48123.1 hypothetical protein SAMN04487981_105198 [Streptomyces sp. cf386]
MPVEPTGSAGHGAVSPVSAVLAEHAARLQAALFAGDEAGGSFDENLALARGAKQAASPTVVRSETVNGQSDFLPLGYSYSTPTMLVLFVFINALAGGAAIVQTRRTGVYARALPAPVAARTLVFGETIACLLLAVLQSLLIVGVGAPAFNAQWGDPPAAGVLVTAWAVVGHRRRCAGRGPVPYAGAGARNRPHPRHRDGHAGRLHVAAGRGPRPAARRRTRDAARLGRRRVDDAPVPGREPGRDPARRGHPRRLATALLTVASLSLRHRLTTGAGA